MKKVTFLFIACIGISACMAIPVEDKDLLVYKMPYDSYCKVSLHASLKRSLKTERSEAIMKSIGFIEFQLVTDLAYLDFVIKNKKDDNEYAKYVFNMIVFGLREGYISGGENIRSKELLVHLKKDWTVNMDEIYKNAIIPDDQKLEFEKWFSKHNSK